MADLVWLVSYPESGHGALAKFLFAYFRKLEATPSDVELRRLVAQDHDGRLYEDASGMEFEKLHPADIHRFRTIVQQSMKDMHPNSVLVESCSPNATLGGVPLITPEPTAGIIYVIRNPANAARAFAKKTGANLDTIIEAFGKDEFFPSNGEDNLPSFCGNWSFNVKSWTEEDYPKPVLVLRYEDLEASPEEEFAKMTQFLGIEADAERLAASAKAAGLGEEDLGPALTEEQMALLREAHGETMAKWGY